MIRRWFAKRESEEFFKEEPVVDLVFQFGIGIDAKPFSQHQTFKEHQWRKGSSTFTTAANSVMAQ